MLFNQIKYQLYFALPAALILISFGDFIRVDHPLAGFGIIFLASNFGVVMYNIVEAIKGKK